MFLQFPSNACPNLTSIITMSSAKGGSTNTGRSSSLPIFVFPEELQFVEADRASHKQILTIYNPYSFSVRFKVFCTAPDYYAVEESSGSIKANCCVDLVVRHRTTCNRSGPYVKDKFRVDIYAGKKIIGRKLIPSMLVKDCPENLSSKQLDDGAVASNGCVKHSTGVSLRPAVSHGPSMLMLLIALICLLALFLPMEGDTSSINLPPHLHMSVNLKLIAAFGLGLVMMAIMRA